jgi:glycosyltransferase involved in cell wall biosynthesis
MNESKVTVLMSVFNGEKFLREAVESILSQTFEDFEFLIIDDGSTDDSASIISSYHDPRIKLVTNNSNIGLSKSLNRGLKVSKGEYIVRMDADDISLPQRLEKQVEYMESEQEVAVLATKIALIDSDGNRVGYWNDDQCTSTTEEIIERLPKANCIAHPSVVMRRDIVIDYLYNENLNNSQDYDLWLRLAADGMRISKINEIFVLHRTHKSSITYCTNANSPNIKIILTRILFLLSRIKLCRFSKFDLSVGKMLTYDVFCILKRHFHERFVHLRAFVSLLLRLVILRFSKASLFLFFPYYHIGGAEKVHARIVDALSDKSPVVFFTNNSNQEGYLGLFGRHASIYAIERILSNVRLRGVFVWWLLKIILSKNSPYVIGSNCSLFYELLPRFSAGGAYCIDIIHGLGGGVEERTLGSVKYLDRRVVVAGDMKSDLCVVYSNHNIPAEYYDRIRVIENFPEPQNVKIDKDFSASLKLIYVGRGAPEKRLEILGRVARKCVERGVVAEFVFVGPDCRDVVRREDREFCRFWGAITASKILEELYCSSHILLLASIREGLPLALLDGMAFGVVPLVTGVGCIPQHVCNGINGFLLDAGLEFDTLVDKYFAIIDKLNRDRNLLQLVSDRAATYAHENFSREKFIESWQAFFS